MTHLTSAQKSEPAAESSRPISDRNWWLFCLGIITLKFLLLAADPLPKFFLRDSNSYLWTAISGWIPGDRSYFYGYLIRWVALPTSSLTSLLIVQVFAGATIAILLAWACLSIFRLPRWVSFLFGFLCAVDPLQLYWEHAVMTETLSLLFYVFLLQRSFLYVKKRRLIDLFLVQLLSILVIGFRMSYLVLVLVIGVALPVVAFFPTLALTSFRDGLMALRRVSWSKKVLRPVSHWIFSVALMIILHGAYRRANGFLSHREPGYLYTSGFQLLSIWAPALRPEDAADNHLALLISKGDEFNIKDLNSRPAQLFANGGMIDRLCQVEPDRIQADEVAKQTALRALRRNPVAIAEITLRTYLAFWNVDRIIRYAGKDIFGRQFTEADVARMSQTFHVVVPVGDLSEQRSTWMARYYVWGWPYYWVILLSPVILAVVVIMQRSGRIYTLLLGLNLVVLFGSTLLFSIYPVVRYLHPLSFLSLLTLAAGTKVLSERRW